MAVSARKLSSQSEQEDRQELGNSDATQGLGTARRPKTTSCRATFWRQGVRHLLDRPSHRDLAASTAHRAPRTGRRDVAPLPPNNPERRRSFPAHRPVTPQSSNPPDHQPHGPEHSHTRGHQPGRWNL